jgi:hypothetical protein
MSSSSSGPGPKYYDLSTLLFNVVVLSLPFTPITFAKVPVYETLVIECFDPRFGRQFLSNVTGLTRLIEYGLELFKQYISMA